MAIVAGNAIISLVVDPVMTLLKKVISEEDNRQILQTDLRRMESLLEDIITLFRDEVDIITLFQDQQNLPWLKIVEILKIWLQLLHNSLTEAQSLLSINRSGPRQSCLDCLVCNPGRLSNDIRDWNAFFDQLYHDFQSDLSMVLTSLQFASSRPLHIEEAVLQDQDEDEESIERQDQDGDDLSRPLHIEEAVLQDQDEGEESIERQPPIERQPLSRDEVWVLFRRVAFKDKEVSMDIEEPARRLAEECKGVPLAIKMVAAMIGGTSVDKWDASFSLKKDVDPSFPATHPGGLDAHLYTLLRWCYDALPNSEVRNCFLYCAMFPENKEIDSRQLLEMWIAEGLVKSKQGTHVMDMAIGRKYLKLLLDRCFFQNLQNSTNIFRKGDKCHDVIPSIRVEAPIRDMAVYIGEKEGNCLFMADQNVRNFPEIHNESWGRISLANNLIEDLPIGLRFPNLTCLTLEGNSGLKELSSGFLLSLTSLRVLNLSRCTQITSVPTSVGQLRLLEFLSLRHTAIYALPDEICHLSRLQFLDLSYCDSLKSLPSTIGQLKHLKHLNLDLCGSLRMIPREISELTSLSRLQLVTGTSGVETRISGLKFLMELEVLIRDETQCIMGTCLEMRHLHLYGSGGLEDLFREMQSMKKLQSFLLSTYKGLSLPNCMFEHLERVELRYCENIREISRLEWLLNLKLLKLRRCRNLRELGIGSRGRVRSGYLMLQKLVLKGLMNLESLDGSSNSGGVWDETTLPQLRVLKIAKCSSLKRFPIGMEKLPKLSALMVHPKESIMWEDDNMKVQLQHIFKEYIPSHPSYR